MAIPALDAISAPTATGYLSASERAGNAGDGAFQAQLSGAIDNLQQLQGTSNELAIRAVTGDLDDIHSATIASTRAAVTLELVAAVRNKGVDAFNEIMRMQA
ncbi:MAG TPA: flagellar hook-basal body complex protein FliE [Marisediminicola sp.]|nr:flagellar hook-basal body complex protein FliE [Marisediminicola sp.]